MDEALELKRILKKICEKLEYGETSGTIMDINGNKVGQWSRQECLGCLEFIACQKGGKNNEEK